MTLTMSSVRVCLQARSVLTRPSLQSLLTSSHPPPSNSPTSPTSSLRKSLRSRMFLPDLLLHSLHVCPHLRHPSDLPQLPLAQGNCRQRWMSSFFSLGQGDLLQGLLCRTPKGKMRSSPLTLKRGSQTRSGLASGISTGNTWLSLVN